MPFIVIFSIFLNFFTKKSCANFIFIIVRFQFAASQWQLLVSSAEDLLSEILRSTQVSPTEKARIESWLCLKAEAEECIGMDLGPLRFNAATNRVLEVIGKSEFFGYVTEAFAA